MNIFEELENHLGVKPETKQAEALHEPPAKIPVSTNIDDYYNDRSLWSNSMAKELKSDEVEFDEWYNSQKRRPCEDKFAVGQYLHYVLESRLQRNSDAPTANDCNFIIMPKLDKRTKEGKAKYEALFRGKNKDYFYVIEEEVASKVNRLVDMFLASDEFKNLGLDNGYKVEAEYINDYEGIGIKGKLDVVTPDCVIDWKSTSSYSDWASKARYYDYDQQAAWYLELTGRQCFKFVVFDTVKFNRFFIAEVTPEFIESGRRKMKASIELIKRYLTEGVSGKTFRYKKI